MRRLLISALLLCSAPVSAQHLAPEDYIFPLRDVAGLYSANFGEMRPNHFHSGIDIKTDGVTGKPVLATADGYISRIAVTPGGYGRAIYITHPNGTTSVYGHLSKFRDDIEKYVHEERYRTRRNSINLYPPADRFPLKQGEQFAWSGNTGSSAGPHLHFEIRDSRTQRTLNTISSGVIRTRDDIPPRLVKLYYVEVDSVRGVPVHARPRPVELVEKTPGRYALKQEGALSVGVFYEPLFFSQSSRPAQFAAAPSVAVLSPLYSILDYDTPLHTAATVTIRAYVPQNLQPHTTLGFVRKGKVSYAGGKYKNGAVTLSTRTLGDFCVVADTVPPRIEPRFKAGEPIRTRSITFRLRDNFSGIGSYTATLDGEWILLERNPMQGTITHTFDDSRTPKGRSYTLQLTVTDNCGNKTVWKRTITR